MPDQDFLKYLFNEEIYIIPGEDTFSSLIQSQLPVSEPDQVEAEPEIQAITTSQETPAQQYQKPEPLPPPTVPERKEATEKPASPLEPAPTVTQPSNAPVATPADPFAYEGAYKSRILILTDAYGPIEKDLLGKILSARGLSLDDAGVIRLTNEPVKLQPLARQLAPQFLLLFGGDGKTEPKLTQQKYTIIPSPKLSMLLADSLTIIAQDVELKKKLWAQIQLLFPKK